MKAVHLIAFVAGLIFSVGLAIGGMTQPAKVVGFLDIFGDWDPSLAFVMGGALLVNLGVYRLTKSNRDRPVLHTRFHLPEKTGIDARLLGGAALFGIGWGLSGYCPGPALTSLVTGIAPVLVFTGFMALGIYGHTIIKRIAPDLSTPLQNQGGDGE